MTLVGLISKLVLATWAILQRHGLFFQRWYLGPRLFDMVNIPLFSRVYTSQVVRDFFHQQYEYRFRGFGFNLQPFSFGTAGVLVAFCINVVIPAPWDWTEDIWSETEVFTLQLVIWSLIHTWWDFLNTKTLIGCANGTSKGLTIQHVRLTWIWLEVLSSHRSQRVVLLRVDH